MVDGILSPDVQGGGIFNFRGQLTMSNTIIAGNTAPTSVHVWDPILEETIEIELISHDVSSDRAIISMGHNLIGISDHSTGWGATDRTGTAGEPLDPLLAPLGDYGGPTWTMPLLPGSPALNAGASGDGIPATDQRGLARVGGVDIGAFESQGFTLTPVAGSTPQSALVDAAFANPLAVSVTANNPVESVDGGVVRFTAPESGASASLSDGAATIANGQAAVTATANAIDGSYTVTAATAGATSVGFGLTNTLPNQPPTLAVPAAQTAFEDVDLALTGITVGDPDGDPLTVTLAVGHGTLTLGTTAGLTVSGNGSGAVTLSGSIAALNAALASLLYRGLLNYSGADMLSVSVSDGSLSTNGSVAISVKSAAQQAADLEAHVNALVASGVLTSGQGEALNLNLRENNGDAGKVQAFLNQVAAFLNGGILTQAEADVLLHLGNNLLLSVTRR
jgi:hypothetical protein